MRRRARRACCNLLNLCLAYADRLRRAMHVSDTWVRRFEVFVACKCKLCGMIVAYSVVVA